MNLFVGNLPISVDAVELRRIFNEAGFEVESARVIEDRTNRSKGYGFVETLAGKRAINELNGMTIQHHVIVVNEALPRENRRQGQRAAGFRAPTPRSQGVTFQGTKETEPTSVVVADTKTPAPTVLHDTSSSIPVVVPKGWLLLTVKQVNVVENEAVLVLDEAPNREVRYKINNPRENIGEGDKIFATLISKHGELSINKKLRPHFVDMSETVSKINEKIGSGIPCIMLEGKGTRIETMTRRLDELRRNFRNIEVINLPIAPTSPKPQVNLVIDGPSEDLIKFIGKNLRRGFLIYPEEYSNHIQIVRNLVSGAIIECDFEAVLRNEKDTWVIVADEAGPVEDHARRVTVPSEMIFVCIPPGSELQAMKPGFHGMEKRFPVLQAITDLTKKPNVHVFTLPWKSGSIPLGIENVVTVTPHIELWRLGLPLVLERIASIEPRQKKHVKIVFEQVGNQLGGESQALASDIIGLRQALQSRPSWSALEIDGPHVVPKDVHPWLGYPDAVGLVLRRPMVYEEGIRSELMQRANTVRLPFQQVSLEKIRALLLQSGSAPDAYLLLLIRTLGPSDVSTYGASLRFSILETMTRMSNRDWGNFTTSLTQLMNNQPNSYAAVEFVLREIDFSNEELRKIFKNTPTNYFVLLNCRTSSANHRGEPDLAKQFIDEWTAFRAKHEPTAEAEDWHVILRSGMETNQMAFDKALSIVADRAYARESATEFSAQVLKSCHMQYLALAGRTQEALDAMKGLRGPSAAATHEDFRRLRLYFAHIYYDAEKFDEMAAALSEAAEGSLTNKNEVARAVSESPYFTATLLKLWATSPNLMPDWGWSIIESTKVIEKVISRNPYDSIAFWAAILEKNQPSTTANRFAGVFKGLCENIDGDVVGLIRTCYLRAFVHEGLCDEKFWKSYEEGMLANSSGIVRAWYNGKKISVARSIGDCLTPLFFNYR